MIDEEIIKSLECCSDKQKNCDDCPAIGYECTELEKNALNLIQRQQSELDKMRDDYEFLKSKYIVDSIWEEMTGVEVDPMDFCGTICNVAEELIKKATAKAIKEFMERLTEKIGFNCTLVDVYEHIDNIGKEMLKDYT